MEGDRIVEIYEGWLGIPPYAPPEEPEENFEQRTRRWREDHLTEATDGQADPEAAFLARISKWA